VHLKDRDQTKTNRETAMGLNSLVPVIRPKAKIKVAEVDVVDVVAAAVEAVAEAAAKDQEVPISSNNNSEDHNQGVITVVADLKAADAGAMVVAVSDKIIAKTTDRAISKNNNHLCLKSHRSNTCLSAMVWCFTRILRWQKLILSSLP